MITHQGFLDDILENPDDDFPRLIYADWLQDQGEEDRAEFIRVQCELEKNPYAKDFRNPTYVKSYPLTTEWEEAVRLYSEEQNLLTKNQNWRKLVWSKHNTTFCGSVINSWCGVETECGPIFQQFRRGFVSQVECSLKAWEHYGKEIVKQFPISWFTTNDLKVRGDLTHGVMYYRWVVNSDLELDASDFRLSSPRLWRILADLPIDKSLTEGEELEAVSRTCIRWAKTGR